MVHKSSVLISNILLLRSKEGETIKHKADKNGLKLQNKTQIMSDLNEKLQSSSSASKHPLTKFVRIITILNNDLKLFVSHSKIFLFQ